MGETSTNAAVWAMPAERWQKTIKAKNLSKHTEDGYLRTARRWATWLDPTNSALHPIRVRDAVARSA
jgi:hypothetical protein